MRLSVVVPAYNVQDYVGTTLRSLSQQDVPVHEVIVVNDGSTDGTSEVIRQTALAYPLPNFRLIEQRNAGVSVSRNVGLEAASGDYVLFLDGDDTASTTLCGVLQADESFWPDAPPDILTWRFRDLGHEKRAAGEDVRWDRGIPSWSTGPETLHRVLIDRTQLVSLQGTAYRIDFLKDHALVFTPGCASAQDTEFHWKTLGVAHSVRYLDAILSTYVWRPGSTTNSASARRFDGALAYHRGADYLAGLGPEVAELAAAASDKVVPRFMDYLLLYCRSHPGGGARLLEEIEERNPGITAIMQDRIREMEVQGHDVPTKWRLFRRAPRLAVRYFESPWSSSSRPAAIGNLRKLVEHARQGDLVEVLQRRSVELRRRCRLRLGAVRVRHVGPTLSSLKQIHQSWANTSYSADLDYLAEVARRGRNARAVLECGSGATTLVLGALDTPTWSLENHELWSTKVRESLRTIRSSSVEVVDAPLRSYGDYEWYEVPAELPQRFDLVVCDGPHGGTPGGRRGLFHVLADRVEGATVLLDDAQRPAESALLEDLVVRGWSYELRGTGQKRYAVLTKEHST